MSGGILILGAGQAAAQLAISLRQGGYDGAIRMIGDEPYAPYQRPPLSKAFLKERPAAETLLLPPREATGPITGCSLSSARRSPRSICARKQRRRCTTAEVTTTTRWCSRPARARATCRCRASSLAGVFSLRKIDDVRRLRPALDDARRIVIVGGGYIGLEVAAVLRAGGPRGDGGGGRGAGDEARRRRR